MPEVELLDKTEVWVQGVLLESADLRVLAQVAADTLHLERRLVFVTDVRDKHVVFDVLQPRAELADLLGKQKALLDALGSVDGVTLLPGAAIHSRGVLGVIGVAEGDVAQVLTDARRAEAGLRNYISTRVAVVSTGGEVIAGEIVDTNTQTVAELMGAAGYEVTACGSVIDDEEAILGRVLRLASDGFGVVITTGGVGAEDKDRTIEALQRGDPALSTSILASYAVGHGRHVKPSVRIGVGSVGWTRIIALPGPTHEVRAALPVVIDGLEDGWSDSRLAEAIAVVLRSRLRH